MRKSPNFWQQIENGGGPFTYYKLTFLRVSNSKRSFLGCKNYQNVQDYRQSNIFHPQQHQYFLKDEGIANEVTWSILATASGYNTTTKQCRLCLMECWIILFKEELATLNRRQEIFSSCRHKARLTLNPKEVVDD